MRIYAVEGQGDFPTDMMRRDSAMAADHASEAHINATYEDGGNTSRRRVRLMTHEDTISESRWRISGWPVIEGGERNNPEPYKVAFHLYPIGAESKTRTVDVNVDRLDVDGPIVGELGKAVASFIELDRRLDGDQPYLMNAMLGLFAIAVARLDTAAQKNPIVNGIRTRIAWTPDYALEIEIK